MSVVFNDLTNQNGRDNSNNCRSIPQSSALAIERVFEYKQMMVMCRTLGKGLEMKNLICWKNIGGRNLNLMIVSFDWFEDEFEQWPSIALLTMCSSDQDYLGFWHDRTELDSVQLHLDPLGL